MDSWGVLIFYFIQIYMIKVIWNCIWLLNWHDLQYFFNIILWEVVKSICLSQNDLNFTLLIFTLLNHQIRSFLKAKHHWTANHALVTLTQVLTKMCMQGFHDALRFLQSNNLIKCARYIAVESTFLISAKYEDEDDEEEHDPECQDCLRQREVSCRHQSDVTAF